MSKFLLTYIEKENKRALYAYTVSPNNHINYDIVREQEVQAVLQSFASKKIIRVQRKNNNANELVFDNGHVLVIDDRRVFNHTGHMADQYIDKIRRTIIEFSKTLREHKESQEKKNLSNWKKALPKSFVPKVNRNRSSNIGKLIVVGGMTIILATGAIIYNLRDIPTISSPNTLATEVEIASPEVPIEENTQPIEESTQPVISSEPIITPEPVETKNPNECEITIAFSDRTGSGKLQETINTCGSIIEYYCLRYGLPYEPTCAQLTQERGGFDNICQISYRLFAGDNPRHFHVPVYDENGFTGTYDDYTVTKEMLDTLEGNIMAGLSFKRFCVDKFESYTTGLFSYNQGEFALNLACDYFEVDVKDYLGDENSIKARDLINRYYEEKGKTHGDPLYLEHVFSYLPMEERGSNTIQYYLGSELKTITLTNENLIDKSASEDYNNNLSRG